MQSVILLHGFLGQSRNLLTLATRWAERCPQARFLLVDLPGHGQSALPPLDSRLFDLGRSVVETATEKGFSAPLTLVGHSLGGRVALATLEGFASVVRHVVMLDISPAPIDSARSHGKAVLDVLKKAPRSAATRKELSDFLLSCQLARPVVQWLMMNVVEREGSFSWQIQPDALEKLHERFNQEDLFGLLETAQQKTPCLCVRGARSKYVSDEDAQRLRRAGVRVETIEAGHELHVDNLEALLPILVSTLGDGA